MADLGCQAGKVAVHLFAIWTDVFCNFVRKQIFVRGRAESQEDTKNGRERIESIKPRGGKVRVIIQCGYILTSDNNNWSPLILVELSWVEVEMFDCLFKTLLGENVQDSKHNTGERDPRRKSGSDHGEISEPSEEPKAV